MEEKLKELQDEFNNLVEKTKSLNSPIKEEDLLSRECDVEIRLTNGAVLPTYATQGSAGFDLVSNFNAVQDYIIFAAQFNKRDGIDYHIEEFEAKLNKIIIFPKSAAPIPTGIYVAIPAGKELQVRPRSGLAFKEGITISNSPGTIDSDYRGEIIVMLKNDSVNNVTILNNMKVAQAVLADYNVAKFKVVETLSSTERGEQGFGHTGTFKKDKENE